MAHMTPQAFQQLLRNPQFLDQLAELPIDPNAILRQPFQAPSGLGLDPQGGGLGLQLPPGQSGPVVNPGDVALRVPGQPVAPTRAGAGAGVDPWAAFQAVSGLQQQQQQQQPPADAEMLRFGAAQPARPTPFATGPIGPRRRGGSLGEILAGFKNA